MRNILCTSIMVTGLTLSPTGFAKDNSNGKLLATGGVSSFEGAAGGGLTPWALIGSYATADQIGATVFFIIVAFCVYVL